MRSKLVAVLGCLLLVACGTSSASTASGSDADAGDGGDGGDGAASSCTPVTPAGYLWRAEAIDSFPPCLIDGDEPISEATNLGIRLGGTNPTVQFGGDESFCKADYEGCHLHSGCGIFVGFDTTGYPSLVSIDVDFTTATTFEGTMAFEIPMRGCKETVRVRGKKVL